MTIVTQENELVNYDNISKITAVQLTTKNEDDEIVLLFAITNNSIVSDSELEQLAIDILNPATALNSAVLDGVVFLGYFNDMTSSNLAIEKIKNAIQEDKAIVEIPNSDSEVE